MIPAILEAAFRSLLVAVAVWAGLRALRVSNVLAQKAAWALVLAAAALMPLAMRWQWLPAGAAMVLPAQPFQQAMKRLAAYAGETAKPAGQPSSASPQMESLGTPSLSPNSDPVLPRQFLASANSTGYRNSPQGAPAISSSTPPVAPAPARWRPAMLALLVYLAVGACLLLRLLYGLGSALALWFNAEPLTSDSLPHPSLVQGLRLRHSRDLSSPVTIGSGVVLPFDYAEWDAEKLRIVLAHERSHVRQGDFYLQTLAGLYAVLFWFSPLGWWLKRKLSDLSETISDRAGLREAANSSSYAQILLEFAVAPRPTLQGVAMARSSNLSARIERLLNDTTFRQAFVGSRRAFVAVLLVPVALLAATVFLRVDAAGQSSPQSATAPQAQTEPAIAGQANPDQAEPAEPAEPSEASADQEPAAPPAPGGPKAPMPPSGPGSAVVPEGAPPLPPLPAIAPLPPLPPDSDGPGEHSSMSMTSTHTSGTGHRLPKGTYSYSYGYSNSPNGDSYALIKGNGEQVQFSGDWHNGRREDLDKARRQAHGDFLWFTRNGKSYLVEDQAILSQINAMYAPIEALGKQQEELGRQQEALGRQQEALGRQQEQASVPTPDISKEMAQLNAAMTKLQSKMGKTVTQEELADLEGKLGDLQGRLGELQGRMGARQGEFGAQQGKLGAEQGKLGAQQGKLGAEQGRLAQENDRKVKSIIDQTLHDGKARPVQ